MSLLSYLFPLKIAKLSSPYNKEIRINEEKGKLKLLVNGSRQSGEYIEMLWKKAFQTFGLPQKVERLLVLGVGGGTIIHLLRSHYPKAKIVGVDIDQMMIDIGRQYFRLDRMSNLSLVCQDAEKFVQKRHKKFDLVIVDLFVGTHVPDLVRQKSFLKNLRRIGTDAVVINYLREFEYGEKSEELKKTLQTIFAHVADMSISNNRFFLAAMVK